MEMNLIDSIKSEINSTVIDKISNYLNIARGNTSNAITAVIPTVLAYLSEISKTESGASKILKASTDSELRALFSNNNYQTLYERNKNRLLSNGNSLKLDLLGNKEEKFANEIATYANIHKNASSGILSAIFPLILNVVGQRAQDKNSTNLSDIFDDEKTIIYSAIPAGLSSLTNFLGIKREELFGKNTSETTIKHTETIKPINNTKTTTPLDKTILKENKTGTPKWLIPLIGAIIAIVIIWFLINQCKQENQDNVANDNVESQIKESTTYTLNNNEVVDKNGTPLLINGEKILIDDINYKLSDDNFVIDQEGTRILNMEGNEVYIIDHFPIEILGNYDTEKQYFIYDVGEDTEIALPDGEKLNVGKNSTESKLINAIIDDVNVSADDEKSWIVLDRIYFDTDSHEMDSSSLNQIEQIAKILKAYPNVKLKIGGFTDNSAGQEINQPLSENRAKSVMNSLIENGIDANRLEAEGYGESNFICPENDTPECMAKNRRVDIQILSK